MKKVLSIFLAILMVCMTGVVAMAADEEPFIEVKSVSLDKASLSMTYGGTAKLTATVNPSNAMDTRVTWKSSDSKLVSVDNNGNLTAAKDTAETPSGKKTVTITVTSVANPSAKASCVVTVDNDNGTKLSGILNLVLDVVKKVFSFSQGIFSSDVMKELVQKVVDLVKQLLGGGTTTPPVTDPITM